MNAESQKPKTTEELEIACALKELKDTNVADPLFKAIHAAVWDYVVQLCEGNHPILTIKRKAGDGIRRHDESGELSNALLKHIEGPFAHKRSYQFKSDDLNDPFAKKTTQVAEHLAGLPEKLADFIVKESVANGTVSIKNGYQDDVRSGFIIAAQAACNAKLADLIEEKELADMAKQYPSIAILPAGKDRHPITAAITSAVTRVTPNRDRQA